MTGLSLKNKINTLLRIILSKKRCRKCLSPYSEKTSICTINNALIQKSTPFIDSIMTPIYKRDASCNRKVVCKSTVNSLVPALGICVTCSCGHEVNFDYCL